MQCARDMQEHCEMHTKSEAIGKVVVPAMLS